jgi:hypothetical protein
LLCHIERAARKSKLAADTIAECSPQKVLLLLQAAFCRLVGHGHLTKTNQALLKNKSYTAGPGMRAFAAGQ